MDIKPINPESMAGIALRALSHPIIYCTSVLLAIGVTLTLGGWIIATLLGTPAHAASMSVLSLSAVVSLPALACSVAGTFLMSFILRLAPADNNEVAGLLLRIEGTPQHQIVKAIFIQQGHMLSKRQLDIARKAVTDKVLFSVSDEHEVAT